jgi:DNA topoisomerase-1
MLQKGFFDILNEGYTAALEGQLDQIEAGSIDWREAVREFDEKFSRDLETAGEQMPNVKRDGVPLEENCPQCGSQLLMRFGRYGPFIACSNYPECKYTRNLDQPAASEEAAGAEEEIPPCELCGKPMTLKRSRFGTFLGCTGYPECKNIRKTGPKAAPPKPTGVPCPECKQGEIEEKRSRRGKIFYSCNRYPDCTFSLWKKPILRDCPECGATFLLEKVTKKAGTQYVCQTEGCGYVEDAADVEVAV